MFRMKDELMNFNYRALEVPLEAIFPKLDRSRVIDEFKPLSREDPHETIFEVAKHLANGGYTSLLKQNGFWDEGYKEFSGHCHQCTPALGLALRSLGFDVSYLECRRIREGFERTGKIEFVPPSEEPNPEMMQEFCLIGRIPYCCLEIKFGGEMFYVTGKHLRSTETGNIALLTPECYRDMVGVFYHQENMDKSGLYLQPVTPKENSEYIDFTHQVVWKKQTVRDPKPELFATFLRMRLV